MFISMCKALTPMTALQIQPQAARWDIVANGLFTPAQIIPARRQRHIGGSATTAQLRHVRSPEGLWQTAPAQRFDHTCRQAMCCAHASRHRLVATRTASCSLCFTLPCISGSWCEPTMARCSTACWQLQHEQPNVSPSSHMALSLPAALCVDVPLLPAA